METRTITQVKVYKLILNSVFDRCEGVTLVAASTDYDSLVTWYNNQFAPESYRYDSFWLTFLPESPLKMFNPCSSLIPDELDWSGHGVSTEWVDDTLLPELRSKQFTWID